MPKAKPGSTPGEVAAAHSYISDATSKIAKSHDAIMLHVAEQSDTIEDLTAKLQTETEAAVREKVAAKEQYTRDVGALTLKVAALEDKLRRVQATLA